MTLSEFQNQVKRQRSSVISSWCFVADEVLGLTQADAAYELTQAAVKAGYVESRPAPPGETLKHWAVQNKAPLWACFAALDLLIEQGWLPSSDTEWAVLAHLWIRMQGPFNTLEDVMKSVPSYLHEQQAVFGLALVDNQAFMARKKA
ncbi:hypothetical protein [Kistimonas asteriae]|uniref:hypothetical protein n=1 Tax=Kistimonas asteriae TaxID=517724 RepID=UPI001BA8FF5D|nr:hypothetical protein [Kistimonas asteriae]